MPLVIMDFVHALHVFRLYCQQLKHNPSEAEKMLLTEREKRAIADIEAVIREYAPVLMGKVGAAPGKAA